MGFISSSTLECLLTVCLTPFDYHFSIKFSLPFSIVAQFKIGNKCTPLMNLNDLSCVVLNSCFADLVLSYFVSALPWAIFVPPNNNTILHPFFTPPVTHSQY